ncbi:MAG TPA: PDZ domain-containing protein [Thermoanaerobaculia bacterium]
MPSYILSWGDPHERLFDVTLYFTAPADTPRLTLPNWRPGRYLMQNFAANIREWSAGERRIWKDGKSSWRVEARAGDEVTVHYRYYAGVLDAGSSFLDDDEAYFNGSNLFMLVEGLRGEEHRLSIAAPAEWRIETQLRRDGETFVARDYDYLIDSPTIAAATLTRHTFDEAGARVHLVFRGDEGIDTEQFVEPTRLIVREQARLFGGMPTAEYRFLYHVADRWHGVEHEDSCSIIVRRGALLGAQRGDDGVEHFLSITSHELFHAWNVKRMLPAVFLPYDYSVETPTKLLWAMEGLTSYYGGLTLVRAGLWDEQRYLDHLQKEIETLEGMPARSFLSLAQAGYDGWLADPPRMHDFPNASFSFYNKGELVAALLDLTIRQGTEGAKSLDDVVRLLWNEYGAQGRGLEEDAMELAVARVADVGDFFARYVDGVEPLPYAEILAPAGIEVELEPRGISLAAKLRPAGGTLLVDSVVRGGAGMTAGLLPGDELLAIDGTRTTTEAEVERVLKTIREGVSVEMLISRRAMIRTLSLQAQRDPRASVNVRVARPSALRRQWLS